VVLECRDVAGPQGAHGPLIAKWDASWFRRLATTIADLPFQDDSVASAIRRAISADPVAFALLYLSHHLKDRDGNITWSEAHFAWAEQALGWAGAPVEPMENRTAIIAPRECGKSTWWFLILPLWAAVNGHSRFAAAFAHATAQAEAHLSTFKHELDTNALLIVDYPQLCEPMRRKTGTTVADRAGMLHQRSGFVFAARGIDSAVLGMKVGDRRPDLLILDDVEPDEANYSPLQAEKRLGTVTDAILPLNIYARVVFVGTVTMPGSIMHQLVKAAKGVETEKWITENCIVATHFRPILTDDDGTERSLWPSKWPLAWLQSQRHTRSFAKNYDNDPMAREGVYWVKEDFQYGLPEGRRWTKTILSVDPAVTSRKTSDFTGLAVVSFLPELRERPTREYPKGRVLAPSGVAIRESLGVRLSGQHLKDKATELMGRFPEIKAIVVETNQGGDLWVDVFAGVPGVKVITTYATEPKEVRFATALEYWQRSRVWHERRFSTMEEQAVGFPRAAYDDVIDGAVTGVQYFLNPPKTVRAGAKVDNYVGST
jgi:hypothetical protein